MRLYWLRDAQWERIKDLLPGKASDRGVTARDNRLQVHILAFRELGILAGHLDDAHKEQMG